MAGADAILQHMYEAKGHMWSFFLYPQKWHDFQGAQDSTWHWSRYSAKERGNIPTEPGIYTLIVRAGIANHDGASYLMYVGQTNNLRRRFGEYLGKERSVTGRMLIVKLLNQCPEHLWFCYTRVPLEDLDEAEKALAEAFGPPCNTKDTGILGVTRKAFS